MAMTSFSLKILAISCMLIDHIGSLILYDSPYYLLLRGIGRLCFPIMAYLIAEGYLHTKNLDGYLLRLGGFAILSEPIFDFAFYSTWVFWDSQNIFFTLFLGLLAVHVWETTLAHSKAQGLSMILILILFAGLISADYGGRGVLLVLFCHWGRKLAPKYGKWALYGGFLSGTLLLSLSSWIFPQILCMLAVIPIALYNGKRGPKMTYFFYAFYPLHLLALGVLAKIL